MNQATGNELPVLSSDELARPKEGACDLDIALYDHIEHRRPEEVAQG